PGDILLRRLRAGPVLVRDQIRQPHRLAQLLGPAGGRGRHGAGPFGGNAADRGALQPLRRASGPCLRRRPPPDRVALLHERRGDDLPADRRLSRPGLATASPRGGMPSYPAGRAVQWSMIALASACAAREGDWRAWTIWNRSSKDIRSG